MDLQAPLTNGSAHHEQEDPTDDGINSDITTSTPTRNNHRALRRTAAAGVNGAMASEEDLSERLTSAGLSSDEESGELPANRSNGHLLISRQDLRRLESIMSTTSLRSSRREPSFGCDMSTDFEEADDDMKDFALQYASNIIQQSLNQLSTQNQTGEDNLNLLHNLMGSQTQQQTDSGEVTAGLTGEPAMVEGIS